MTVSAFAAHSALNTPNLSPQTTRFRTTHACAPRPESAQDAAVDVLVIGGGAAGFYLAQTAAARLGTNARILIAEGGASVLRKVRISGGGRCNVTSALHEGDALAFAANYPRGSRAMPGVLARHDARDVAAFFESRGVPLKTEASGKMFPTSDRSADVVRALVNAATRCGVQVRTGARISRISHTGDEFVADVADGSALRAQCVALTTGDARAPLRWAAALGHSIIQQIPSLFSFVVRDNLLKDLAGVSVADCGLRLEGTPDSGHKPRKRVRHAQRGPLLVTHWGLSGPAVLALSAFAARDMHAVKYKAKCIVDWAVSLSHADKEGRVKAARDSHAARYAVNENPFRDVLPRRLWRALVTRCGILDGTRWGDVSNAAAARLVDAVHKCEMEVEGRGEFKDEFVTAGGVALSSVDLSTFESKFVPGLYFAGEVLDVDGSKFFILARLADQSLTCL